MAMNKEYLKSYLYGVEVKLSSVIVSGVLNRAGKMAVMREVKEKIREVQLLSESEKNQLWVWCTGFYRHCIAGAGRRSDLNDRGEMLYTVLRNDAAGLESLKNSLADSVEFRRKHSELIDLLRNDDHKFYYCTVHKNCAEGHLAYQGRVYYRGSGAYSDEEMDYINSHGLMSVDEVVMGPVWLTTRRNCRHRLIPISFLTVKTGDYSDVRNMNEISYEDGEYRKYRDRYKMLAKFKKMFVDSGVEVPRQMKTDIKRTRLLVLNWNRARKEKKKKRGK